MDNHDIVGLLRTNDEVSSMTNAVLSSRRPVLQALSPNADTRLRPALKASGRPFSKAFQSVGFLGKFFSPNAKTVGFGKTASLSKNFFRMGLGVGLAAFVGYVTMNLPIVHHFAAPYLQGILPVGEKIMYHAAENIQQVPDFFSTVYDAMMPDALLVPSHWASVSQAAFNHASIADIMNTSSGHLPADVFSRILTPDTMHPVNSDGSHLWHADLSKLKDMMNYFNIGSPEKPNPEGILHAIYAMEPKDFQTFMDFEHEASHGMTMGVR